jgi:hypothetical protein
MEKIHACKKTVALTLVGLGLFCFQPPVFAASTASFYFAPSDGVYSVGDSFSVILAVDSGEQPVNAVEGAIAFPTDLLKVTVIDQNSSIVDHWLRTPVVDTAQGMIQFSGVDLTPGGYQGSAGNVMTIVFQALQNGSADLRTVSGSILAHDGAGTNVAGALGEASFTIGQKKAAADMAAPAGTATELTPLPSCLPLLQQPQAPSEKASVQRMVIVRPDRRVPMLCGLAGVFLLTSAYLLAVVFRLRRKPSRAHPR